MGKYIIEARNDKNSHNTSQSAYKTVRASFLPGVDEHVLINGLERRVLKVIHVPSGSLPKVIVDMPTVAEIHDLIEIYGWQAKLKW